MNIWTGKSSLVRQSRSAFPTGSNSPLRDAPRTRSRFMAEQLDSSAALKASTSCAAARGLELQSSSDASSVCALPCIRSLTRALEPPSGGGPDEMRADIRTYGCDAKLLNAQTLRNRAHAPSGRAGLH